MNLPPNTALVIVDVQRAIDDPSWAIDGPRNNPDAEANIATLLAAWRRIGYPIFHVAERIMEFGELEAAESGVRKGVSSNASLLSEVGGR